MESCRQISILLCLCATALCAGCALHYYDKTSGTEHLWGFGHTKMKAEPSTNNVRAIVKGTQLFGVNIGAGQQDYYFSAGWDNRRQITVMDNASVSLDWPGNSFFNVRVGSEPFFLTNHPSPPETKK